MIIEHQRDNRTSKTRSEDAETHVRLVSESRVSRQTERNVNKKTANSQEASHDIWAILYAFRHTRQSDVHRPNMRPLARSKDLLDIEGGNWARGCASAEGGGLKPTPGAWTKIAAAGLDDSANDDSWHQRMLSAIGAVSDGVAMPGLFDACRSAAWETFPC